MSEDNIVQEEDREELVDEKEIEDVEEEIGAEETAGTEKGEQTDEKDDKKKKRSFGKKSKPDTVTVKKKEWDDMSAACAEYLDAAKRIKAEFDNFRKRNETVRSDSYNEGVAQAVLMMLPVLDNLERAQETFAQAEEGQRVGMELILRQMMDSLEKLGVELIPAEGVKFDPNLHQAVMQIEAGEDQESGDVAQVLMKGYRMGDKVLRYAMVAVVQ